MKKFLYSPVIIALAVCVVVLALGAGANKTVTGIDQNISSVTSSAVNSNVDTVKWNREGSVSGLAFGIHCTDSASITNVIVRRVIDGQLTKRVAGDTLSALGFTSVTNDTAANATITLAPLADAYWIFVTYAGSGNGVTTPTVKYEFIKQFSRR